MLFINDNGVSRPMTEEEERDYLSENNSEQDISQDERIAELESMINALLNGVTE